MLSASIASPPALRPLDLLRVLLAALAIAGSIACEERGRLGGGVPSNRARFMYDCNLGGLTGNMVMDVEAITTAGVVYGPGPSPDITGVIGTGSVLYLTAGELVSPSARYVFTGDNQYADFTETTGSFERFRVQWVSDPSGLVMVINPFGPGPTRHGCVQTSASYL
jgi:hypothetical protein